MRLPCKTWTAWLDTDELDWATGAAVDEVFAKTGCPKRLAITERTL
jgi:hypothetical protein